MYLARFRELVCLALLPAAAWYAGAPFNAGAADLASTDIGNPAPAGRATPVDGGYDVVGGGVGLGGASDQFQFAHELRPGNFDVKVRVQAVTAPGRLARVGLMARDTLDADSPFVAVLATPGAAGCIFGFRSAAGSNAMFHGFFPANFPHTWLRLLRSGDQFIGLAGLDGENWVQVGQVGLSLNAAYLGFAVTSQEPNATATGEFRDFAPASGTAFGVVPFPFEPLGPSSRRTGLVISEIMYKPAPGSSPREIQRRPWQPLKANEAFSLSHQRGEGWGEGWENPRRSPTLQQSDESHAARTATPLTLTLSSLRGVPMNGPFTTDDENGTAGPLTPSLSPSEGERVPAGRVRGIFTVEGIPPPGVVHPTASPISASAGALGGGDVSISRGEDRELEYIELYNSNPFFEDLSGYRLAGEVEFTFPPNTVMPGESFLVIARKPADVSAVYGITNVLGPYSNSLKRSGTVRLCNDRGAIYLEVPYSNRPPWPVAADGAGHSLVLARPSYGEAYAQAWAASDAVGGSPGKAETFTPEPLRDVVINEWLAYGESPSAGFIELYNHSNRTNDLSGCALSDDPVTNKFVVPDGTVIAPRGFLVLDTAQLGFALRPAGGTVYLRGPGAPREIDPLPGSPASPEDLVAWGQARVLDAVAYEGQARGVSFGRSADGASPLYPLTSPTPGASNSRPLVPDVVIDELMAAPISGNSDDEYIELFNRRTNAIDLAGWQLTGGVNFTFPAGSVIPGQGYRVVAKNVTNLLARYANLGGNNAIGNYSGALANRGERVALARPEPVVETNGPGAFVTNTHFVVVDEVSYRAGGQWPRWANEGGSSLELIDPRSNHRLAPNWAESDETAKAPWTTVQASGPMDHGFGPADTLEVLALGEGEYLLDNVEVFAGANGPNLLTPENSTFGSGPGDWIARGNHSRSGLATNSGVGGGPCFYVRASGRGDTLANRLLVPLTSAPTGSVTIRAQVRWLRGWPEILLRLRGNYFEAAGGLLLPANLGTPGARNSRAVTNAGPAVSEVAHSPVLPVPFQPVQVTARVEDPDGVAAVFLRYRVDPTGTFFTAAMVDDGTRGDTVAGDGVYSVLLAGQPAGALLGFFIQAVDSGSPAALTTFPANTRPRALSRECLVRWAEPVPASRFGTYRLWLRQNAINAWTNQPVLGNEPIEGTFVYGTFRAIYNVGARYAGSPFHQEFRSPLDDCHYALEMPGDDLLLGTDNFNKLHAPGNDPFDDPTLQREQTCFWMARQLGLPWLYRRYVNLYVNGNRRGPLMEDTQVPGDDFVEEFFPSDAGGQLFKLQPWTEQPDVPAGPSLPVNNLSWCTLNKFTTAGAIHKLARYRWNYQVRAASARDRGPASVEVGPGGDLLSRGDGIASDYTNVFLLIDAANTPGSGPYVAGLQAVADVDQWLRTFALHHASGNWDSFGYLNGQNMYAYKPRRGKWQLLTWDWNIVLGNGSDGPDGNNLFASNAQGLPGQPNGDPMLGRIYATPDFRRIYLRALKEIAEGPMRNDRVDPVMDAQYAAFLADGLNVASPEAAGLKSFIAAMRASLLTTLTNENAVGVAFSVSGPNEFTAASNLVVLSGTAPLEAAGLRANGAEYPLSWVSPVAWRLQVPLSAGTNSLLVQAFDATGAVLPNASRTLTVRYSGLAIPPADAMMFNEIMYQPRLAEGSYVEIFNAATNFAFDLSGWRIRGLDYVFPAGTVLPGRQFLVLAKNRAVFNAAYGNGSVVFDEFDGALRNDAETLTLEEPVPVVSTNANHVPTTNFAYAVVDQVRYEARPPWPANASGLGSALQLVDPDQDNRRPGNWSDGTGWQFYSQTGRPGANATNLLLFLLSAGDLYLDNLSLVAGPVAEAGNNYIQNGDFESPLTGSWRVTGNHSNSAISTTVTFAGRSSLHIVAGGAGSLNSSITQTLEGIDPTDIYTVSFWYLASTTATSFLWRVTTAFRPVPWVNVGRAPATPGAANSTALALPPFASLWLNEIQPENVGGGADGAGELDPWLELYNAGTNILSLDGLYLANSLSNFTPWPFPAGAVIQPGEFKLIWVDGQPEQSTSVEWHTGFRLTEGSGSLALARLFHGQPQVMDYLNYSDLPAGISFGAWPDGQPIERQAFFYATPGGPNDPSVAPLQIAINEWMASNTRTLADPADGQFDDWLELYNAGPDPANLAGYFLTDRLGDPFRFRIPAGYVIPPGGFLLVWADSQPGQNRAERPDLHVSFRLERDGEAIGLFAPDGVLVDAVTFGRQTNDVSQGRLPDGAASFQFLRSATPRQSNVPLPTNTAPVLDPISDLTVNELTQVRFVAQAEDADQPAQTLTFTLDPGAPAGATISSSGLFRWIPSEAQGPGFYSVTVRVTDDGTPSRSATRTFGITVRDVNSPPVFVDTREKWVKAEHLLAFPTAIDRDVPRQNLSFFYDEELLPGAFLEPETGMLYWAPPEGHPPGTYFPTVYVLDDGEPIQFATFTYTIHVLDSFSPLVVVSADRVGDQLQLSWAAIPGKRYLVEYQTTLGRSDWVTLIVTPPAVSEQATVLDSLSSGPRRFYRVIELE